MIYYVVIIALAVLAGILEAVILRLRHAQKLQAQVAELQIAQSRTADLQSRIEELKAQSDQQSQSYLTAITAERQKQEALAAELTSDKQKIAELQTRLSEQTAKFKEQLELLSTAKEQMKQEFENLAQKIFEEKGKAFTEQNKTSLNTLLSPLKDQIDQFKKKVEEVYIDEGKERFSLKNEVQKLHTAYESLSKEADNLVKALKADAKTQGNWGELNLKRILEFAGLKEGLHYESQASYKNEEGRNLRPDVVVRLPDNRQVIVDSKVSLNGYEAYFSATSDPDKEAAVKRHLTSIRNHVNELAEKKYDDLIGINTLDFVLMFIPIEAAYFLALDSDPNLYEYASARKVLLVCPSTLLITMQMVASIWRVEDQNQNAREIAEQGARLYDKFVGFISNLDDLKKHLDKTQDAYEEARKKLVDGKGNLVSQANKLLNLGVKPKTRLTRIQAPNLLPEYTVDNESEPEDAQNLENNADTDASPQ